MRVGTRVRHRTRGWTGTIEAVVSQPLMRWLDRKVLVRVDMPGRAGSLRYQAWASDLEPIAPLSPAVIETGLAEDGCIDTVTPFRRAVTPAEATGGRRVGPFVVYDGGDAA